MIVISDPVDIASTGQVRVVVCSTKISKPKRDVDVELPWAADGKSLTRLRERTIAVCDWIDCIPVAGIMPDDYAGILKRAKLEEVLSHAKSHLS